MDLRFDFATLTAEAFQPLVGEDFTARADGEDEQETLRLIDILHASLPPRPGSRHGFTLVFDGTRTDVWIGAMLEVSHPAIGALMLKLDLIARHPEGNFQYHAAFG